MKIGNLASLGIILAAAGGIAIGLSGNKDKGKDDPIDGGSAEVYNPKIFEHEVIPQAVKVGNRHVYVSGIARGNKNIKDTNVGHVVEYESSAITPDVLCPVILDAREKTLGTIKVPDVAIFNESWSKDANHIPEKIDLSEQGGKWMWYVVLKGHDCISVVSLPQYVGSSSEEFDKLNPSDRRRIFRKIVACGDDGQAQCIVPIDPGDKTGEFFMELSGRPDLKFMKVEDGKVQKRYTEPDGGFAGE